MEVVMFPDYHGFEESVNLQLGWLQNLPGGSRRTGVVHEPLPVSYFHDAIRFSNKAMDLGTFWDRISLEEHWGPANPYKKLYKFLVDAGYYLKPLDHTFSDRVDLSRDFKKLILDYRRLDNKGVPKEDLMNDFARLKRRLSFMREAVFAEVVDKIRYESAGRVVFIAHPSHLASCGSYFERTQGYDVKIQNIDDELTKRLGEEEDKLQMRFAEEKRILDMKNPPFVPAVALAWNEVKFVW